MPSWLLLFIGCVSAFLAGLLQFFLIWVVANRASVSMIYGVAVSALFWTCAAATFVTVPTLEDGHWYGYAVMVLALLCGLFFLQMIHSFRMEVWPRIQLFGYKLGKVLRLYK